MPLKFDDAAEHAATLPNIGDRFAAFLNSIKSRLQQVDGRAALNNLISELDQHHDLIVRTAVGDAGTAAAGYRGRLGPNETPLMPGDRPMSALDADRHSNPTAPVDSSGFKVHPSDAITNAGRTDPKAGNAFGGNGMGTSADVRTQAALAARDAPTTSLQERGAGDSPVLERGPEFLDRPMMGSGKIIPVIKNEVVAGSEVERAGVKYVTKRRPDGSTFEAIDDRPANEPIDRS